MLAAGISASSAAITFVSVATDLSNISPSTTADIVAGGNLKTDNKWGQRDGYGETGATILESWDASGLDENPTTLTQTITGLTVGSNYDIYVNYLRFGAGTDPDGNRGGISGSLDNSTFTVFNDAGGTAGTVGFSELTGFSNSDRRGLRGYLGTAVANASGEVLVYVAGDATIQERIWYDGASYTAVPEPSSAALLGLGGIALILRRRK